MFIEELLATMNLRLAQYNCMWAYTIHQDWKNHKIDLTEEQATDIYFICDYYLEESEKWYNTVVSIVNDRKRVKRRKKFFLEKLKGTTRDAGKISRILKANDGKYTLWW